VPSPAESKGRSKGRSKGKPKEKKVIVVNEKSKGRSGDVVPASPAPPKPATKTTSQAKVSPATQRSDQTAHRATTIPAPTTSRSLPNAVPTGTNPTPAPLSVSTPVSSSVVLPSSSSSSSSSSSAQLNPTPKTLKKEKEDDETVCSTFLKAHYGGGMDVFKEKNERWFFSDLIADGSAADQDGKRRGGGGEEEEEEEGEAMAMGKTLSPVLDETPSSNPSMFDSSDALPGST
jgi:hypothetical protein